jgi:hypothetical protein
MAYCIAITGALVVFFLWIGPETRGRILNDAEEADADQPQPAAAAR